MEQFGSGKFVAPMSYSEMDTSEVTVKAGQVSQPFKADLNPEVKEEENLEDNYQDVEYDETVEDSIPPVPENPSPGYIRFLEENFGKYWLVTVLLSVLVVYLYFKIRKA